MFYFSGWNPYLSFLHFLTRQSRWTRHFDGRNPMITMIFCSTSPILWWTPPLCAWRKAHKEPQRPRKEVADLGRLNWCLDGIVLDGTVESSDRGFIAQNFWAKFSSDPSFWRDDPRSATRVILVVWKLRVSQVGKRILWLNLRWVWAKVKQWIGKWPLFQTWHSNMGTEGQGEIGPPDSTQVWRSEIPHQI